MSRFTGLMCWPNHRQTFLTAAQWPPTIRDQIGGTQTNRCEYNPQLHRRLRKWLQYKQKVQNHWTSVLSHRAIGPPALSRHTGPAVQRIIVKCCFMKTGGDFKPLFKVGRLIFRSLLACCQASDNTVIEPEPFLWLDSF